MKNKKIIAIALIIITVHFLLTSLIGNYIAVQVGTEIGQVVASGLMAAGNKSTTYSEDEAKRIYKDMKNESQVIDGRWKLATLLISLPVKPLINPLLKKTRVEQINRLVAKDITKDQFRIRGLMTDYITNFLNSLCVGILFLVCFGMLRNKRRR